MRARYVALVVIACLLPIINPSWDQLYYLALLGLFALIGWGQVRVGRVGLSRQELALLFCDLALLTFIAVVPNPFSSAEFCMSPTFAFSIVRPASITNLWEATSPISLYPGWTRSRPHIFPARTFSIFKANSPSRTRGCAS